MRSNTSLRVECESFFAWNPRGSRTPLASSLHRSCSPSHTQDPCPSGKTAVPNPKYVLVPGDPDMSRSPVSSAYMYTSATDPPQVTVDGEHRTVERTDLQGVTRRLAYRENWKALNCA